MSDTLKDIGMFLLAIAFAVASFIALIAIYLVIACIPVGIIGGCVWVVLAALKHFGVI